MGKSTQKFLIKNLLIFIFGMTLVFFIFSISISSKKSESYWKTYDITPDTEIIFLSENTDNYLDNKAITFNKEENKGLIIKNINLVERFCYLKLSDPEKDILIECVIKENGDEKIIDPRFINFKK